MKIYFKIFNRKKILLKNFKLLITQKSEKI